MSPVLEPYRQQIEASCRRFHVRRLEVFGSALRDDFDRARSDVDFLVEFDASPGTSTSSKPISTCGSSFVNCWAGRWTW